MATFIRFRLWVLRGLWVVLALFAGAAAADGLSERSTPVTGVVAAISWLGWTSALVAMLVPRTLSLTAIRTLVPAGLVVTIVLVAQGERFSVTDGLALVAASAAFVLVQLPLVVDAFVDGSSYGPERRIALRTPAALSLLASLTWLLMLVGAFTGPLLLAARQWVAGLVALALGAAAIGLGARSIHQLARRWLVLVPTGLVLQDPLVMPEPQLFLRQTMARLGPALAEAPDPVEGDADGPVTQDLTAGASGLVMALTLSEPVELLLREGGDTALRSVDVVLFSPALPADLLAEAAERRLPVA